MRFKKIASVLASTAMVLSTVGLAAATTYPAPFVNNGVADVAIVYGSHPSASSDMVAVVNIQNSLNSFAVEDSVTADTDVEGGDFVKLEKASTKFHLGNGILDVVSSSITDSDLPVLLTDGTYTDDDNDDFEYTQKLTLTNQSLSMFDDNDYKEDTPTIGFSISSGANIMNYTLDFSTDPLWADLAQTDLEIMGKNYFILSTTTNTTLNLLDSGVTSLVDEGELVTVTTGDKTYEVSAQVYSSTQVRLKINGESTNSLNVGETQKLAGTDTYVGVKNIFYVSKDTGVSSVEFAIGSGKLELVSGQNIEMNDVDIDGLSATFTNSADSKLQKIVIAWNAEDEFFVTEDSSITMPGFENVKLSFTGMTYPAEEMFTVQGGSSNYVQLNDFPTKESTDDINLLYGASGQYTGIGKDSDEVLRTTNETSITFNQNTDELFIASYDDGSDAESYLIRTSGRSHNDDYSENKTTVQYKKEGTWVDLQKDVTDGDSVTIGNVQLTVGDIDYEDKTTVFTRGSSVNFNKLYSAEGLKVWLPWQWSPANYTALGNGSRGVWMGNTSAPGYKSNYGNTSWNLEFEEEDKSENVGSGLDFNMTLAWNADAEAHVSDLGGESVTAAEVGDTNTFRTFMYSALATEFLWDQGSGTSEQDNIDVTYHGAESTANVFLTDVSATIGGESGNIGAPILDTEIAEAAGKNLIVVGGSCVNTVAAQLFVGRTDRFCGDDWTAATGIGPDKFLIQTFSRTGGDVATLVAGWSAQDTSNAATALTTQENVDTSVGKKYTGTTATSIESAITA